MSSRMIIHYKVKSTTLHSSDKACKLQKLRTSCFQEGNEAKEASLVKKLVTQIVLSLKIYPVLENWFLLTCKSCYAHMHSYTSFVYFLLELLCH